MADFLTFLTADCTESDEVIHVASNEGARTTYPWRIVIEAEALYVFGGVAEGLDWEVHRAADDTDAALHLAGVIVEGKRRGEFETDEPMMEDGVTPAVPLDTEDLTDWLRTDPTSEGV